MTVAVAVAMSLHCYCTAWKVYKARKQIFNREFMEKSSDCCIGVKWLKKLMREEIQMLETVFMLINCRTSK